MIWIEWKLNKWETIVLFKKIKKRYIYENEEWEKIMSLIQPAKLTITAMIFIIKEIVVVYEKTV